MTSYIDPSRFPGPDPYAPLGDKPSFPVESTSFTTAAELPASMAAPQNISPHLAWRDLPEGTKSIAITCFDPDAPTASGFWHWAVCNIPVGTTELSEGAGGTTLAGVPGAIVLRNDTGQPGYYGPNPPAGHGPHRYIFVVHAVDVPELPVTAESRPAELGFNLYFHTLGRGIVWGWTENQAAQD